MIKSVGYGVVCREAWEESGSLWLGLGSLAKYKIKANVSFDTETTFSGIKKRILQLFIDYPASLLV